MVLTFEPVGEVLWCYNTNENYWAVLCCEAVYCTLNSDSNFWTYQWYPFKLLDVSINNGNWTEWNVIWSDDFVESINPWSVLGSRKCRCDHSNDITFCQPFSFVIDFTRLKEVLACSRLRDSGEKSFSIKKCEKRIGAGRTCLIFRSARFNTSPLYYLRAWHSLTNFRISNIGFVPAWSLVPTSLPRWYHFWRHRASLGKFRTLFFQTWVDTGTLPQPIWHKNDENLFQIPDQWEKLKYIYIYLF